MGFYKSRGIDTVKIGVKDYSKNSIYIYNDTVIILLSNRVIDKIDRLCKEIKDANDFDGKAQLCRLIQMKEPLNVMMIRDKKITSYYRNQICSLVNSAK